MKGCCYKSFVLLMCFCFIFESVAAPLTGMPSNFSANDTAGSMALPGSNADQESWRTVSPFDQNLWPDPTSPDFQLGLHVDPQTLEEVFAPDSAVLKSLPFAFENRIVDTFHMGAQTAEFYKRVDKTTQVEVDTRYALHDLQVNVPVVHIADPAALEFKRGDDGSLLVDFFAEKVVKKNRQTKQALRQQYLKLNTAEEQEALAAENKILKARHIIHNLGIKDLPQAVAHDGNFVLMVTDTGIKVIFRPHSDSVLFQAPLPVITIMPGLATADNIEILGIEILHVGSAPRALLNSEDLTQVKSFQEGDICIRVRLDGEEKYLTIKRATLVKSVRFQMSIFYSLVFLMNPSVKGSAAFYQHLKRETALREIDAGVEKVAEALASEGLVNLAEKNPALAADLMNGPNSMQELWRVYTKLDAPEEKGLANYALVAGEGGVENLGNNFKANEKGLDDFASLEKSIRTTVKTEDWLKLYQKTQNLPLTFKKAQELVVAEQDENNLWDKFVQWRLRKRDKVPAKLLGPADKIVKLLDWREALANLYQVLPEEQKKANAFEALLNAPQNPTAIADLIIKKNSHDVADLYRGMGKTALKVVGALAAVGVSAEIIEVTGQTGYTVDMLQNTYALISQMAHYAIKNEFVDALIGPLVTSADYFEGLIKEGAWGDIMLWVSGASAAASMCFVSLMFGARKFFSTGIKLYLALNSFHKHLFKWLGLQHMVEGVAKGLNPWKNKGLYKSARTPGQAAVALKEVEKIWSQDRQIRRSALLAVLGESLGLDEAARQELQAKAASLKNDLIGEASEALLPSPTERQGLLREKLQKKGAALLTSEEKTAVEKAAAQCDTKFAQLSAKIKTIIDEEIAKEKLAPGTELSAKGWKRVEERSKAIFKEVTGLMKSAVEGIVFGKQTTKSNHDLRDVYLDDETVRIAKYQYAVDYIMSAWQAALSLPTRYGKFLEFLWNSEGALAMTDTLEQLVLYGGLGAIGPFYSLQKQTEFKEAWKPLINTVEPRDKKVISSWRSTVEYIVSRFKGKVKGGITDVQLNSEIVPSLYGFEARLWFGGIPRFLAFLFLFKEAQHLTWAEAASSPSLVLSSLAIGMSLQAFFNLSKFSINWGAFYPGLEMPGLSIGYCGFWGMVLSALRYIPKVVAENRELIFKVDHYLNEAITTESPEMMKEAYKAVNEVLEKAKVKLPAELKLPPGGEYDLSHVKKLQAWFASVGNKTLPTKESAVWIFWMNTAGSVISVVLYAFVSLKIMTPDMTIGTSLRFFGGSIVSIFSTILLYQGFLYVLNQHWPKKIKEYFTKAKKKRTATQMPAEDAALAKYYQARPVQTTDQKQEAISSSCATYLRK